jgi:hypothetical protein
MIMEIERSWERNGYELACIYDERKDRERTGKRYRNLEAV